MALSYTLKDNAGGKLALVGKEVRAASALAAGTLNYTITATDDGGWTKDFSGAITVATAGISAVHPADYGTPPTNGYSMRRLRAAYTGNAATVSGNTVTTVVTVPFASTARDALIDDTVLTSALSGNTELRHRSWLDQFGSLNLASTSATTGPRLQRGLTGVGGTPGTKPTANAQGLTSNTAAATGPFNLGGSGDKLTVIMALAVLGYGGASFGTGLPSSVSTALGTALGFGSDTTSEFLSLTETDNIVSSEPTYGGVCVLRDDITTLFERSTDFGRLRTLALKFEGTKVSGFMGSKKKFETTLTFTEMDAVRVWIGSTSGPAATANAEYKEVLIWNDFLVPDADILSIMKNVGQFWNAYADPAETNDLNIVLFSQSNGINNENTWWPALRTRLLTLLGSNAAIHRLPAQFNGNTGFGGAALQKAAATLDSGTGINYFLEQNGSDGPRLTTAKAALSAYATRSRPFYGIIAIGEQESVGVEDGPSTFSGAGQSLAGQAEPEVYAAFMRQIVTAYETAIGRPGITWNIEALHKQDGYSTGYEKIRQAQMDVADADPRIGFYSPTLDLGLETTDKIHYTSVEQVNKQMPRRANRIAMAVKPSLSLNIEGPRITNFRFTDANRTVIRATLTHAQNGGTDFTPTTGISGFAVWDSDGDITVTAARETATTILLTLSRAANAASAKSQYIRGNVYDETKTIVDNATVPFPAEAGRPMTVIAA